MPRKPPDETTVAVAVPPPETPDSVSAAKRTCLLLPVLVPTRTADKVDPPDETKILPAADRAVERGRSTPDDTTSAPRHGRAAVDAAATHLLGGARIDRQAAHRPAALRDHQHAGYDPVPPDTPPIEVVLPRTYPDRTLSSPPDEIVAPTDDGAALEDQGPGLEHARAHRRAAREDLLDTWPRRP